MSTCNLKDVIEQECDSVIDVYTIDKRTKVSVRKPMMYLELLDHVIEQKNGCFLVVEQKEKGFSDSDQWTVYCVCEPFLGIPEDWREYPTLPKYLTH